MKDELITFETAKLAKEKGFDVELKTAYIGGKFFESEEEPNGYDGYYPSFTSDFNKNGWSYNREGLCSTQEPDNKKYFEACSAPTQSLLQRWLREVHDIKLCISYTCIDDSEYAYIWDITTPTEKGRKKDSWDFNEKRDSFSRMSWWETYEQALEEGLLEALKLIEV